MAAVFHCGRLASPLVGLLDGPLAAPCDCGPSPRSHGIEAIGSGWRKPRRPAEAENLAKPLFDQAGLRRQTVIHHGRPQTLIDLLGVGPVVACAHSCFVSRSAFGVDFIMLSTRGSVSEIWTDCARCFHVFVATNGGADIPAAPGCPFFVQQRQSKVDLCAGSDAIRG